MTTKPIPIWQPRQETGGQQMVRFRDFVNTSLGLTLRSYDDLHHFSISRRNDFWLLLWRFFDIKSSVSSPIAVDESLSIDVRPPFFAGARLNYAENVLKRGGDTLALIALEERSISESGGGGGDVGGRGERVTWDQLRSRTLALANALLGAGVVVGSVIAYVGCNTVNAVVTQLATAAIGALFTSLAADMGEDSIIERLAQVAPVVVFAEAAYRYNGKLHVGLTKASRVVLALRARNKSNGLPHAILVPNADYDALAVPSPEATACCWTPLATFLQHASRTPSTSFSFAQVPFDHPMLILFSSGTTGAPKGIIHSHGGVMVNLLKEHVLHENMGPADIYYHYSNIGWTMWNIFLGGLLSGATLVLYDGSPFYPSPAQNLRSILDIGTTVFGASPRYYDELRRYDVVPRRDMNVTNLRLIGNTGANLPATIWTWLADSFGGKPIFSFSGGTEICGSFLHGTLMKPHFAGEITVPALGVDAAAFDPDGVSCDNDIPGELVCRRSIPNAAVGLWNDPDGSRYHKSYFSQYPGVWTQGDFCRFSAATGGITMLGRSDGTLNPSGVRFGSAEIYSILDKDFRNTIADSLCVGRQTPQENEQVYLFLQMSPGAHFTPSLEGRIRARIAEVLSRRHVPSYVYEIPKVPYNVNGKKLEVPVKLIISGRRIDDRVRATVADAKELEYFRQYAGGQDGKTRETKL